MSYSPLIRGTADGFAVKYEDSTHVDITAGIYEGNGKLYTLSSAHNHLMTTLVSAFDHHYIYIDDSASTPPAPTFYDSTSEPVLSVVKNGWYHPTNTDDRMVGGHPSSDGAATLIESAVTGKGKEITLEVGRDILPSMASAMNPTGVWQQPNGTESDVLTPVNAVSLRFYLFNTNDKANISLYIGAREISTLAGALTYAQYLHGGYSRGIIMDWINLGAGRKVSIAGNDVADNALEGDVIGWKYTR
jgi:hypothetical protein